jgi:hypothetical protein
MQPAAAEPSGKTQQLKPNKRCTLCNEAGFLELRHEETGALSVHRCPHEPELVQSIEERLKAYL